MDINGHFSAPKLRSFHPKILSQLGDTILAIHESKIGFKRIQPTQGEIRGDEMI
jgi:hypothetical protein